MINEKHYQLLKQLRDPDHALRHEALVSLMELESEEELVAEDFVQLLQEEDPVLQQYASEAIGRNRVEAAYGALSAFYQMAKNPIILTVVLNVFHEIGDDQFFDSVKTRLEEPLINEPKSREDKPVHGSDLMDQLFGEEELLDQILVPSLKYFQTMDSIKQHEFLYPFLQHKNVHVRWNTLMVFNRLEIRLDLKLLEEISKKDTYAPNRELADIMRTKFSAP